LVHLRSRCAVAPEKKTDHNSLFLPHFKEKEKYILLPLEGSLPKLHTKKGPWPKHVWNGSDCDRHGNARVRLRKGSVPHPRPLQCVAHWYGGRGPLSLAAVFLRAPAAPPRRLPFHGKPAAGGHELDGNPLSGLYRASCRGHRHPLRPAVARVLPCGEDRGAGRGALPGAVHSFTGDASANGDALRGGLARSSAIFGRNGSGGGGGSAHLFPAGW
jgi:hypothetical protein